MDPASREPALKADPAVQIRLLDVQDADTRLAQLSHRAATLPDAARLAEVEARLSRVGDEHDAAETIVIDLLRDQERADRDVEQVRERMARDRHLLDSGTIGDPKQLQSLQAELESLARRQSDLEDVELEIMERVEGARAAVAQLTGERDALAQERDLLAASVHEQKSALEAERRLIGEQRAIVATEIPTDLLGLYDKIRADHGGVGAAPLHRGTCQGCRLALPPTEIEDLRAAPPDEVIRCEECRRILVRTPESGLSS
jgi:predicted  nucleic acid-binding Zn-ribbon protein